MHGHHLFRGHRAFGLHSPSRAASLVLVTREVDRKPDIGCVGTTGTRRMHKTPRRSARRRHAPVPTRLHRTIVLLPPPRSARPQPTHGNQPVRVPRFAKPAPPTTAAAGRRALRAAVARRRGGCRSPRSGARRRDGAGLRAPGHARQARGGAATTAAPRPGAGADPRRRHDGGARAHDSRQTGRCARRPLDAGAAVGALAPRDQRGRRDVGRTLGVGAQRVARALRAVAGGDDRGLRRQRRAVRQGRRLRDPERAGRLDRAHRRQPLGHHGPAVVRDDAPAAARRRGHRAQHRLRTHGHSRHPDQLVAAGDPRGHRRERRRAGAAHRARARARAGRQRLPGQGRARAAGHAKRVRRRRPGARGLPARGRPAHQQRRAHRGCAAGADRAPGVRRADPAGAGDQGSDRHQGRAAVDAGLDRRAHAGVPAARHPHRHLAEDRLARGARGVACTHAGAGGRWRRRFHPAHQRRGRQRHRAGRRHRLSAQGLGHDPRVGRPATRPARCCTRI